MKNSNRVTQLKDEYIEYFKDVPIQKYAAMFIKRDEDTIIRWRKADTEFADRVNQAKAEWVRKRLVATKAEFALERLEKSIFSEKVQNEDISPISLILEKYGLKPGESIELDE